MFSIRKKLQIPTAAEALPGRAEPIVTAKSHFVNGHALAPPYPESFERVREGSVHRFQPRNADNSTHK